MAAFYAVRVQQASGDCCTDTAIGRRTGRLINRVENILTTVCRIVADKNCVNRTYERTSDGREDCGEVVLVESGFDQNIFPQTCLRVFQRFFRVPIRCTHCDDQNVNNNLWSLINEKIYITFIKHCCYILHGLVMTYSIPGKHNNLMIYA